MKNKITKIMIIVTLLMTTAISVQASVFGQSVIPGHATGGCSC